MGNFTNGKKNRNLLFLAAFLIIRKKVAEETPPEHWHGAFVSIAFFDLGMDNQKKDYYQER